MMCILFLWNFIGPVTNYFLWAIFSDPDAPGGTPVMQQPIQVFSLALVPIFGFTYLNYCHSNCLHHDVRVSCVCILVESLKNAKVIFALQKD